MVKGKSVIIFFLKTVKVLFIVFCVFLIFLVFHKISLPDALKDRLAATLSPEGYVLRADAVSFGLLRGISVRDLRFYALDHVDQPLLRADLIEAYPLSRRVQIDGLVYARLPDGYYAPGNQERNEPLHIPFPDVGMFSLVLNHPDILAARPESVVAEISITPQRLLADRVRISWPDRDEEMSLDGFCDIDLGRQTLRGEVRGSAKQHHIRPLIEALDIPVALPYIDGFTEVTGKVPSACRWSVGLINNDTDIELDLSPDLGRYNLVPMRHADGKLRLHVFTRGSSLNYRHVFGPISAIDAEGRPLDGTVTVEGLNGTNTVRVTASSAMPVARLLKIGGFTDDYVDDEVVGKSSCDLEFNFPRAMTNNYELLNGRGHLDIRDGQVMRMSGFRGLVSMLADKVPGVSWFTDSTQASCDYTIKNGVVRSDNIYIEGSVFSIKMFGTYDAVNEALNFTVRVQFMKKDSLVGQVLHPLTWPFTKLLLEFRLTGSPESPKWDYLSVIDRVMEIVK